MKRCAHRWPLTIAVVVTASVLWIVSSAATDQEILPYEVLDLDEAAALLRVTPEVVRALAEAQRMPARRVGAMWRFSRTALIQWLKGEQVTEPMPPAARPSGLEQSQTIARELRSLMARGIASQSSIAIAQASPPPKPEPAKLPPPIVGERPTAPTAEEIALRDQRVLVRRGAATVDLGVSYGRSEKTLFPVIRVEQNSATASATVRYGLLDDLQVTTRLPVVWRRSATFSDAGISGRRSLRTTHEYYLGDASISLLGLAWREAVALPTVVWSLDGVVPTGPGDGGLGGGFVLSKSYDPAVLFAGISYLHGLGIDRSDMRRSMASHNLGFHLGYTYAVNDTLALNTALLGIYRNSLAPDKGAISLPHERYDLQVGTTWLLARRLFMEPAVAMRLGGDSPDLTFSVNLSQSF